SWWFLAAGSFGLVLGMALAYFVITRNQPALVLAAGSCVAYFALGSLVTATTGGGVVPTPAVLRQLAHELGFGWKELLTTLPPVASTGPLLALPFVIGLVTGALGGWVAGRTRLAIPPLLVPLAALSATILIGTHAPGHPIAQGAVFAVLALAWASIRSGRLRPPVSNGVAATSRLVTAAVLLAASA